MPLNDIGSNFVPAVAALSCVMSFLPSEGRSGVAPPGGHRTYISMMAQLSHEVARCIFMSQRTFYLEQAENCAHCARQTVLENQRDEFLAAEKAWRRLAEIPTMISFTARAGSIVLKG